GLIAHLAQTLAQRPEVIKRSVIDFGMVTAQDDLMLVIAENAALEFAGYGHGGPLVSCAAANEDWYYVHSRRINTAASEPWWQDVPWLSTRNRIHRWPDRTQIPTPTASPGMPWRWTSGRGVARTMTRKG